MAKWPTALSCGDEQNLLYNPVKIVKFIRKKEVYLNRNLLNKDQAIFRFHTNMEGNAENAEILARKKWLPELVSDVMDNSP